MSITLSNLFELEKCEKCEKSKKECDTCDKYICTECDIEDIEDIEKKEIHISHIGHIDHMLCLECKTIPICKNGIICGLCYRPYHYITDRVAIGNSGTSYNHFDIVINMNCPYNGLKEGQLTYNYDQKNKLHLIKCGIQDCGSEEYKPFAKHVFQEITRAIHYITQKGKEKVDPKKYVEHPRILFHCYAGISRSVAAAIWYLSEKFKKPRNVIYEMIKEKRKIASPNQGFMSLLGI